MNQINVHQLELPDNFREDFLKKLFQVIRSAESGMIVGPAGMGKTLTLELLEETAIQKRYLPSIAIKCVHLNLQSVSADEIATTFHGLTIPSTTKLLIVADNAEALESERSRALIQRLKDVREQFRPQTTILLSAERNVLDSESFSENSSLRSILMENLLYISPLNKSESTAFAEAIGRQLDFKISPKLLKLITEASGGAPRIIKRLVKIAQTDEKQVLEVLKNPALDQKLSFDLESLAIFTHSNPSYIFNSPLLATLLPTRKSNDKVGPVQFSIALTKQEHSLAKILIENQGELVSREEMIKAIWPRNLYETSEHALDQMIHRLKKKIESGSPPCTLITYRGRGAKLTI